MDISFKDDVAAILLILFLHDSTPPDMASHRVYGFGQGGGGLLVSAELDSLFLLCLPARQ